MTQRDLSGLLALLIVGCTPNDEPPPVVSHSDTIVETDSEPVVDTDSDVPDPVETDTPSTPLCEPPLTATGGIVVVNESLTVVAQGGTGDYRFDTLDDGEVNPLSGVFLSPSTAGEHRVEVTDEGCEGSAEAVIEVFSRIEVTPIAATVLPNTTLQLSVSGGSGDWVCERFLGDGLVSPDCLIQVPATGAVVVQVRDLVSGDVVEATMSADPEAAFTVDPTHLLVLPPGRSRTITTTGGTGVWDIQTLDPSVASLVDDVVTAVAPGTTSLTLSDAYTGESAELTVQVIEALPVPLGPRFGELTRMHSVVQPGDVDGDGFEDVFFGDTDISQQSYRGGTVFQIEVDSATSATLAPHYLGTWISEQVGISQALLDADGDGLEDLVVGALLTDDIASDTGRVDIYRRTATGFEDEPFMRLYGTSSDRHGEAVGACDVNGDGFGDLIVGVPLAEDDNQLVLRSNQGAVWVYYGGPTGLADQHAEVRYGQVPTDTGWEDRQDLRMGSRIATGDVNGDGLCDVAVGQQARGFSAPSAGGGFVHLFLGDATTGLSLNPVHSFEGTPELNELGFSIAMGDLDGDSRDELVIGQPRMQLEDGRDRGAVYVYLAGGLDLGLAERSVLMTGDQADWTVHGVANSDLFGDAIRLSDADGDDTPDLFIGAALSEYAGQASASGDVVVFLADRIAADIDAGAPDPIATDADHQWPGQESAAVGSGFAVLDDLDGDGWPEVLARGPRDDTLGRDVGQYWLLSSAVDGVHTPLGYDGITAERKIGESVAAAVIDEATVLVVASPHDSHDDRLQPGALHAFDAETGELVWDPPMHPTQSDSDRLGWSLSLAGDVDGDGLAPDLVVAAQDDERQSDLGAYNPSDCDVPSVSNAGAALVYRRVADGLWSETPSAAFYGPWVSGHAWRVTGGYDFDGDGFDDLALSGDDWYGADTGGVRVHFGRVLDDGIELLCDPVDLEGVETGAHFGRSLTGLHDIDGDGCDELAVGAYQEDLVGNAAQLTSQGTVRVFFGIGESCTTRGVVTLMSQGSSAEAGYAIASGDLDGDGLDDLAVGVGSTRPQGTSVGSAWVVPGSKLLALLEAPWLHPFTGPASVPASSDITPADMASPFIDRLSVWGKTSASYGDAVAIIPSAASESGMALAVGAPQDDEYNLNAGEVTVYRWDGVGLVRTPMVRIAGDDIDGHAGHSVAGAGGFLVYGAPWSHALSPDNGAAFTVAVP